MKNETNEMNENVPGSEGQIEQAQHEKLCAYVFGELAGAERAEFEAELMRSPALQAERARLVATIGLVQRAVPDEGLSHEVRRDLVASARRSRFRVLRGRNLARLAAAAVLIVGGVMAVRLATDEDGPFTRELREDAQVARRDEVLERKKVTLEEEQVRTARGKEAKEELEALRELGYADGDAPAAAPTAAERSELGELGYGGEEPPNAPAPTALDRFGENADAKVAAVTTGTGQDLVSFDQTGIDSAEPAPALEAQLYAIQPAPDPNATPTASTTISVGTGGHYGTGTPSAFVSGRAGRAAPGSPASPGLRQSAGGGSGGVSPAAQQPPLAKQGAYRGPGDTKPPSASAGEAPTDGFFLGHGAKPSSRPEAAQGLVDGVTANDVEMLNALGYVGGGEDDEELHAALGVPSAREPVQTREQVIAQVEGLLRAPRIAPEESPTEMFFRYWGESPSVLTAEQTLSTFAVDVDTASYAFARSCLARGLLPPRESVRTEEFVNYFKADQPPPTDGQPFAIGLELAPSLFAKDARTETLRVTVRGKEVADFERQPAALTFVIDNSGSMEEGGRLELVKRSLSLLLRELGAGDSVAVVKFSNSAAVVTPSLPATRRGELESLIHALPIEGGTNVEAGLRLGYELALASLQRNAVNRVILCSDGVGNIGETKATGLVALVKDAREKGIYLNTVGVGMGHSDAFLEQLADQGDGLCNYVDSDAEAKRVFVDGLARAIQPIARDVKIQVEFDPAQVESWRLLGYENRALRTQDFRDDAIDAGEVNAGHQVTALYELVRLPTGGGPLATVRVRYKPPFAIDQGAEGDRARAAAEQALEIERTLATSDARPGFAAASGGYQRAVLVAQLAEVLRQSVHARGDSLARLVEESRRLATTLGDPDFTEFVALLAKANPLLDARTKDETKVQPLLDELAQLHFELGQAERRRQLQTDAARSSAELEERLGALGEGLRERDEVQRREQELRARIEGLESQVREELLRSGGLDPAIEQLKKLGYVR